MLCVFLTFSVAAIWLYKLIVAASHAPLQLTAFGGDRLQSLYKSVERHNSRFKCSPIGPIGRHLVCHNYLWLLSLLITIPVHYRIHYLALFASMQQLASDCWSVAIDYALGRLLDAFIVSCHKDSLVLRECAKEANYRNLQIIIYDFAKPR
jgi:hypothetical protein